MLIAFPRAENKVSLSRRRAAEAAACGPAFRVRRFRLASCPISGFPLDPLIGDTPPNAGAAPSDVATLLFDSGVANSLNLGVVIGAGVTTPGAATVAG